MGMLARFRDALGVAQEVTPARPLPTATYNSAGQNASDGSVATFRQLQSTADQNPNVVRAVPATLYKVTCNNTTATKRYLKIYDKATTPLVGDTPVMTIPLLASQAFDRNWFTGRKFANGIGYRITGAIADADATNIAAADIECITFDYS